MAKLTVGQSQAVRDVIRYLASLAESEPSPIYTAERAADALALLAENALERMLAGPSPEAARAGIAAVKQLRTTVQALGPDDGRHIIELRPDGFTIQHPLACRPILFNCPVNRVAQEDLAEPPAEYGRFYCELRDGWLAILDRVDAPAEGEAADV